MEVGAVKQAFNNEVILLKKNLNQAKIHVIHKLTRKAKTLTEKKTPDHLKEKLKRKAESAVNEVLLIKKIKPRDIAKFIITHTGKVEAYINRPNVDIDKCCARLVLHKSLQDKYKFIRNRFGNVPIKDLFMSRQERRKIKKEAREQQKNKKKGKEGKKCNAAGDWDVEDVEMADVSRDVSQNNATKDETSSNNESADTEAEENEVSSEEGDSVDDTKNLLKNMNSQSDDDISIDDDDEDDLKQEDDNDVNDGLDNTGMFVKVKPQKEIKSIKSTTQQGERGKCETAKTDTFKPKIQDQKQIPKKVKEKKQTDAKIRENKNKNLKEKLQNRQFKKDKDQTQIEGRKVVDPFFITATGENYLSLAEPREPDEIKEVHKQGNRQERRAAMFGHVAKSKPRRENFGQNNFKSNKYGQDSYNNGPSNGFRNNDRFSNSGNSNNRSDRFDNRNINDRNSKFNDRNGKFNDRNGKFNDRNAMFNDRNTKFNESRNNNSSINSTIERKEEKLHPSWEAKRKLKSMSLLPAQGKKIVFNDN